MGRGTKVKERRWVWKFSGEYIPFEMSLLCASIAGYKKLTDLSSYLQSLRALKILPWKEETYQ